VRSFGSKWPPKVKPRPRFRNGSLIKREEASLGRIYPNKKTKLRLMGTQVGNTQSKKLGTHK
jgi:hypothetical protein